MIYETEKVIKLLQECGIKDPRSAWVTTCCVKKKEFAEALFAACGRSDIRVHILMAASFITDDEDEAEKIAEIIYRFIAKGEITDEII